MYPVRPTQYSRFSNLTETQPMRAPVLSDVTDEEKKIAQYQTGFATRLRHSQYYVIEVTKSTGMPSIIPNIYLSLIIL